MAPVAHNKRRRVDDERKPKKKLRVKKQKTYHSSSEDDSADEGAAFDAPKVAKLSQQTPKPAAPRPKPILKHSTGPSQPQPQPASDRSAANQDLEAEEDEEDDDDEVDEAAKNTALNMGAAVEESSADEDENDEPELAESSSASDDEDGEDLPSDSEASMTSSQAATRAKRKRNDPDAFATSITKILGSKLSSNKRSDPVLSRSKSAADANKTLADERLEARAKAQIRSEKKAALEKGRVKDVLGLESESVDTGAVLEDEKRLKKTAQRGVVKLFNAVRAAQVKAEEAMKQAKSEGVVGMRQREERVNEMSKQGFLDLISSGGKKSAEGTPA
ncbi:hypothetical protein KC332_g7295 [Hortaea werneckii]|uniref:Rrp15p-domain-containing protein n=2 Tax=Hortaea werneckii TaxID=91943 RepID=A0A3M7IJB1_HORWE|nr:hypothetical protein KC358_g6800 [Hortaea werneckii]OTA31972.1 hypothetical protein BTJ68_08802 [Hortaea werneckii EXF-2000]KAI6836102.1 hypothetical protein KC350_g6360 [Hortaea werneckii]KAI6908641.1 hypothetical protein KC348_g13766 [Hortaea werneckii]KAI6935852.1 hypothetical protein KC341_g6619 [Hortaea werneckii]